jgi:hypothetical protein
MKRNAFFFLLTLMSLFAFNDLSAQQDKIYLINGNVVEGSIIETGDDLVKIKIKREGEDDLIRTFNTEEINKIVFRDGTVEVLKHDLEVTPAMDISEMKKRGVKINFFGPLYGHTDITYEQYLSPGRLYEVTLGIIGLGKNRELDALGISGNKEKRDAAGAFVSGGYKFQTKPTYRVKNMRYTHLMQGWFIKPNLSLGFYSQNRVVGDSFSGNGEVERENITFGALEIKFGRQWVFSNSFYLGLDMGLGYVMDNVKYDDTFFFDDITRSHYALRKFGDDNTAFGGSFAVQVGFLF